MCSWEASLQRPALQKHMMWLRCALRQTMPHRSRCRLLVAGNPLSCPKMDADPPLYDLVKEPVRVLHSLLCIGKSNSLACLLLEKSHMNLLRLLSERRWHLLCDKYPCKQHGLADRCRWSCVVDRKVIRKGARITR